MTVNIGGSPFEEVSVSVVQAAQLLREIPAPLRHRFPESRKTWFCYSRSQFHPSRRMEPEHEERVGFEPTSPVKGQRFSRPPRSTTTQSLRVPEPLSGNVFAPSWAVSLPSRWWLCPPFVHHSCGR